MRSYKRTYRIGGFLVRMTDAQAARWNTASTTPYDLRTIIVDDRMTLARATNQRLEPVIAAALENAHAELAEEVK